MATDFGSFGVVKHKLWHFSWRLSSFASRNCEGNLGLKTTSDGKSERIKVVDNLMKFNLKKKFSKFGAILNELLLFKVRVLKLPPRIENEKLNYCCGLILDL